MNKAIIHLSDLHYRQGWIEEQGVVLDMFFKDLRQQIEQLGSSNVYLAFSGDVVQAGDNSTLYEDFILQFDRELNNLNIPKSRRICVPGNHDVSTKEISANIVEHEGVVSQGLDEQQFNDYVSHSSNVFTDKFSQYRAFELRFAAFGAFRDATITGAGWEIADDIGIYCLNTALCCSGALRSGEGNVFADKGRLAIDTRGLHSWNLSCKARSKILIMHHPLDWLAEWAQRELKTILSKDFALCLSGHAHDQSTHHSLSKGTALVECSAPPLFTRKSGDLGYSIISVSDNRGVTEIAYRQWTKYHSFVAGVNFANSDDGKVRIAEEEGNTKPISAGVTGDVDFVDRYFTKRLDEALLSFSSQPKVWVDPVLRTRPEVATDAEAGDKVVLSDFISDPTSTIIKAPPQFGLTSLAHYLIREAWRTKGSSLWLYLDSKSLKPHSASIDKAAEIELKLLGFEMKDVKCIILDSWTTQEKHSRKLLEKLCTHFKNVPVIVMHTLDETEFLSLSGEVVLERTFKVLYLWALPRGHVRKLVADYNETRLIGDEDAVTTKVVSDLEMLNIHRTPLNCLTLLKVSEIDFDESPVNRTEMIKRVLFLLFNADDIPTYKSRPDLKDCEYVLGYFCETMLRENNYYFTRDQFLSVLEAFCKRRFIDLEVQVVFDVLQINNILVKRENLFCFRFAYWIYYFAAQRMHHDDNFANFMFENMRYAKYPEIIEFYTGIDRCREDALRVLIKDVRAAGDKVKVKSGLPDGLNPYRFAQWRPSPTMIEQMQSEISDGVSGSNLPDSVKDRYADRQYDRTRPYYQDIRDILAEYSFILMVQTMRAGAKALRNSDYVDPEIRRQLLQEIMHCWEQASKILLILLPPPSRTRTCDIRRNIILFVGGLW